MENFLRKIIFKSTTTLFLNESLYDCLKNTEISKIDKIETIETLLLEGAAPVFFDAAGMTALYFIEHEEILNLFVKHYLCLFQWQDWWGRYFIDY